MKKKIIFWLLSFLLFLIYATINGCNKQDEEVKSNIIFNPSVNYGTLKDQDGYTYKTVTIGTQTWMAENLKTTKYNDGNPIPNLTDNSLWDNDTKGAYCWYLNDTVNKFTYGALYNWYAVNTGKLAPAGWHISTDEEWTILKNYLIANGFNYDGTKEGYKFAKSLCSKTSWALSDEVGSPGAAPENNNNTGFSALPGGFRGFGSFSFIGIIGEWWSSLNEDVNNVCYQGLYYNARGVARGWDDLNKKSGFSVRCVKD